MEENIFTKIEKQIFSSPCYLSLLLPIYFNPVVITLQRVTFYRLLDLMNSTVSLTINDWVSVKRCLASIKVCGCRHLDM